MNADIRQHLPDECRGQNSTCELNTAEGCYDKTLSQRTITMLRNPRSHVLSQFLNCEPKGKVQQHRSNGTMPTEFSAWVDAWVKLQQDGTKHSAFCCYNPINLQSRHFTCSRGPRTIHDYRYHAQVIDEETAIANMEATFFVGITEAYVESLCLLHERVRGELPRFCDCETRSDPVALAAFPAPHHTHKLMNHSIFDYPDEVLAAVDTLTATDAKLYEAGKRRFYRELLEVENKYGRKINCDSKQHTLRESLASGHDSARGGLSLIDRGAVGKDPDLPTCSI